jgi:hypothetical protein
MRQLVRISGYQCSCCCLLLTNVRANRVAFRLPPSAFEKNYPARTRTLNEGTKIPCVTITPRGTSAQILHQPATPLQARAEGHDRASVEAVSRRFLRSPAPRELPSNVVGRCVSFFMSGLAVGPQISDFPIPRPVFPFRLRHSRNPVRTQADPSCVSRGGLSRSRIGPVRRAITNPGRR